MEISMKTLTLAILAAALFITASAGTALAGPDLFIGDTAIYNGDVTKIKPNVLLIIDNSNVTLNAASGTKYDSSVDYCSTYSSCTYSKNSVYKAGQQGDYSTSSLVDNPDSNLTNINCTATTTQSQTDPNIVVNTLRLNGTYTGSATKSVPNIKKASGNSNTAVCDTSGQGATFATGNFLNYTRSSAQGSGDTQRKVVYDAISTVAAGSRYAVNFGAMVYGSNNSGGQVVYQIGDLSSDTNYNAFINSLPGYDQLGNLTGPAVLSSQTARPQAESLLDAGYYFWGMKLPVSNQAAMPSPIQHSCDKNFVIIITNGLTNKDDSPQLGTIVGDYDKDGLEPSKAYSGTYGLGTHFLDDVAKYLYEYPTTSGQSIRTSTILAFQTDDPLVRQTADTKHGRGHYYNVWDENKLVAALNAELANIVSECNTSFVAPVVPVSPENRTYSGTRVYMGFFRPINQRYWDGNLKKYGINSDNNITDTNGNLATYVDLNNDRIDDITGDRNVTNGAFRSTAESFWSSTPDAGTVESGGAGGKLLLPATIPSTPTSFRKIFTYTGSSSNLTDATNSFDVSNTWITTDTLFPGVTKTTTDRNNLIYSMYGYDAYDEDNNGLTLTERRGKNVTETSSLPNGWIMGDILHSKPLIVNYASYIFNSSNEKNCGVNKSMIYVGSNDGMLHAVNDCDGTEAWAFIPPDMLPNLQYLNQAAHAYFVDSSPSVYIYDKNGNGTIETDPANGDKVILIFGERRGGGKDSAPTSGTYYALDVSNPAQPNLLWSLSNQTSGFEELAETWSEPKIVKMNIGGTSKIVAFIGAGYDNIHEDTRFGNTQYFTNAASVSLTDVGNVNTPSGGIITASQLTNPKGRGIYAVEIATLDSNGIPTIDTSVNQIWRYTHANNTSMAYSFPGEISALDLNNDGYADRLYAGDTRGSIWRFDVSSTNTSQWTATRIFRSNPGSGGTSDTGRKIFYKPSVTVESPTLVKLYFGTGDREHPLNWAVTDRFYALKDSGQTSAVTESNMMDVTSDLLQTTSDSNTITNTLNTLNSSSNYGWYIQLNQNYGEKVLAAPTVFNKVAYFTTYAPNTDTTNADPCAGNLGTARLYAVNYLTGEAVLNYNTSNDNIKPPSSRANYYGVGTLDRTDRVMTIGSGIPSGMVLIINPGGETKALIGVGGVIPGETPKKGGSIIPLYWRQK